MRYIKYFLAFCVMFGLTCLVAYVSSADALMIVMSSIIVVSGSIGACLAESMEENKDVESLRKLPKQKP